MFILTIPGTGICSCSFFPLHKYVLKYIQLYTQSTLQFIHFSNMLLSLLHENLDQNRLYSSRSEHILTCFISSCRHSRFKYSMERILGVKVQWPKILKWNVTTIDIDLFKEIGPSSSSGLKLQIDSHRCEPFVSLRVDLVSYHPHAFFALLTAYILLFFHNSWLLLHWNFALY